MVADHCTAAFMPLKIDTRDVKNNFFILESSSYMENFRTSTFDVCFLIAHYDNSSKLLIMETLHYAYQERKLCNNLVVFIIILVTD